MIYNLAGRRVTGEMKLVQSTAAMLETAQQALLRGRYEQAHGLCMRVLAQDAKAHRALYLLAQIAASHQNPYKALEVLERALNISGPNAEYGAFAAQQYLTLNQQSQARLEAEAALAAGPTAAQTFDTIGVVLSRTGAHEDALHCFKQANAMVSDNPSYAYNLASSSQFLGQFELARQGYERAIALQPDHYRSHSALSQLDKQSSERNHIERLLGVFEMVRSDVDGALHIGHALAKEYEDLEDYPRAFAWLQRAKAGKRAQLAHSIDGDLALFEAARQAIGVAAVGSSPAAVTASSPIFVVGMPRTGTTLVDRLLSSHSAVTSVGELTQFALFTKRAMGTSSNLVLDAATLTAATQRPLDTVGREYRAYVARLAGPGQRSLDKMPLNFFYLPLLLKALPDARVVVLRRNPMDTCLSNYRQLFATRFAYYRYAFDIEQTARYYAAFDALMATCRAQLPAAQVCEVHYEAIVADIEPEARRLLRFCGLDWEPGCIDFHRNAAPVATASSVQVREPLYQRASGRWQRYGEALRPLAQALTSCGVAVDWPEPERR